MDGNEISTLYRRPARDASYEVSVHLAKRLQSRFFLYQSIRKKESPVEAMLVNGSGGNEEIM